MKLAVLVLAGFSASLCWTQETAVEPEYNDVFFGLAGGKLIPLERQTSSFHSKTTGYIVVAASKVTSQFSGAKSPVRFTSEKPLEFVIRTPLAMSRSRVDPSTLFALRKFDTKRKSRELRVISAHGSLLGASAKSALDDNVMPVVVSHYGASSLKMVTGVLPRGEYALSNAAYAQTVFCFGVD